ncbi:MAG: chain length determinant family protein [Acidobacteria bacterium]|nr:chain length determinant family protein [Acidobacteriota bacterium]
MNVRSEGKTRDVHLGSPSSPPSRAAQGDLTFLDLLLILTQRKKLIVSATALSVIAALILAFALPQRFTATVLVLPPQGNSLTSLMLATQISRKNGAASWKPGGLPAEKNINDMYVSLMRSPSAEDAVIRQYGLQSEYRRQNLEDTRKALESHTVIDGATKDGLIRLSFTDRDPRRSAEIANGYVDQFKIQTQRLNLTEASQWRTIFENRLTEAKTDLETADEALKKAQPSSRSEQPAPLTLAMIQSAARMRAQIVAREVQLDAMQSYPGDEYPALSQAKTELVQLRTQFDVLDASKDTWPAAMQLGQTSPQASPDYLRRLRDAQFAESTVAALTEQLELARLDEARERAFLQVVSPAVTPHKASSPKRALLVIAGLSVGFTMGIMLALLQGGLVRMQQNPANGEKLQLLKQSLEIGSHAASDLTAKAVGENEEVGSLRPTQPEPSRFETSRS